MSSKERLKKLLGSLEKFPEVKEELTKSGHWEQFLEEVKAVSKETLVEMTTEKGLENLEEVKGKLLETNETQIEFTNLEHLKELQDSLVNVVGEWNELAVELTLAAYSTTESWKTVKPEPETITFGELYGLEENDELFSQEAPLSTDQRKKLDNSAFCGPNKSFPVHDRAHAVAALRLVNRYKGPGDKDAIKACINRKAAKYGVGPSAKKESAIEFFPAYVEVEDTYRPVFTFGDTKESFESVGWKDVVESYGLESNEEQLEKWFLEMSQLREWANGDDFLTPPTIESETEAIKLDTEFLFNFFVKQEEKTEYLVPLVGLVRKLKLDKKTVSEYSEGYKVFSSSILKNFLENVPEETKVEEKKSEEPEVTPKIVAESNPATEVAESSKSSKGNSNFIMRKKIGVQKK